MPQRLDPQTFEAIFMPHLDAAYNLARWLLQNRDDAEDVVQEAVLRALTYSVSFKGTNARAWLLRIVRNAAYASLARDRDPRTMRPEDSAAVLDEIVDTTADPEAHLIQRRERTRLASLIAALPLELRECLVLREIEELSYREIAEITDVPIGTVMSRLWRGRQSLAAVCRLEEIVP